MATKPDAGCASDLLNEEADCLMGKVNSSCQRPWPLTEFSSVRYQTCYSSKDQILRMYALQLMHTCNYNECLG